GRNFDMRKQLLEYDDVMNQQREVIYAQRREILETENVQEVIEDMMLDYVDGLVQRFLSDAPSDWDIDGLQKDLLEQLTIADVDAQAWVDSDDVHNSEDMHKKLVALLTAHLQAKEESAGEEQMRNFAKWLLLQILDNLWKDHLLAMDHLRQSVGLRGYAQKNPIQEYKHESFKLFSVMLERVRSQTIVSLFRVEVQEPEPQPEPEPETITYNIQAKEPAPVTETYQRKGEKIGRNDPCPCGSGKKYKQCHGKKR
ncbi:MAG TPA: preprotein translocase subunit SecA, partial [Ghiorsea sp.]|nr:preprotein translocase subunit SecA [Ghiorsea sp.]